MSDDLSLFGASDAGFDGAPEAGRPPGDHGHGPDPGAPLAARMRPRTLDEFVGQRHLLGEGRALGAMLERESPQSMILWGPPGSGKTTLARLVAERTGTHFEPFSAVTEGIARVREIIAEAGTRLRATGRRTILFCDEIHRFNKAQQDAFLPHVESGTVVLIGATTENPSFEIVRPLLSRAPVYVLEALADADIRRLLERALDDSERGLGALGLTVAPELLDRMAHEADGDARRALGVLEAAAALAGEGGTVDDDVLREAVQHRFAIYDKGGEEHFNLISALHKSVRGSDVDGALYWLARMLEGGEDPLYIARRMVRMAVEDIGLADPRALEVALAGRDAFHFQGSPEGDLALAEVAAYLATSPKSNRIYRAWSEARAAARETPSAPVPLHLRNAPTGLMRDLGYGEGYRYDPDEPGGVAAQGYLPDGLENRRFYRPGRFGYEKTLAERMEWFARRRREAAAGGDGASGGAGRETGDEAGPRDDSGGT